MKRLLFVLVFGLILPLGVQAKEIKVAIFPFKIHAAQDLSYVREGIQDMLSTRLFVPNKVLVIDETKVKKALANLKEPLTEEKAREIGKNLGVDYILSGSITTFGKKVSIDAKLVPVDELKSPVAIYTQTDTLDDMIPKLAEFARRAVAYLEGRPMVAALTTQGQTTQRQTKQEVTPKTPIQATNQQTYSATASPQVYPRQPLPEKLSPPPSQQARLEKRRKYKYSEIDPWPDYPPEEEDYAVPEIQEQAKPKKEHKGHFWNRVWPLRWIFGRKEKEVVLKKEEITPPPPPPPPAQSTGGTTQSSAQVESPSPTKSPPASPSAPPSGGQTWQWY